MKKFVKIISLVLAIVSLLAVAAPALAQTMYVYNVPTNETVRLRSSRSTANNSNVIANIPYGSSVDATKYDNTWHSVTWGNKSGYMLSSYLIGTLPSGSGWVLDYGTETFAPSNTYKVKLMHFQEDLKFYFEHINPNQKPAGWSSNGFADGYFGPRTTAAVQKFQTITPNLQVDGIVGDATKSALWNAVY